MNLLDQRRRPVFDVAILLMGICSTLAVLLLPPMVATGHVGDARIRWTIRLSLAFYAAAVSLMLTLDRQDWLSRSRRGRLARWCWTIAWAVYAVHLAMAFHYYHDWSHAHAVEHTRQVSGLGEGIYMSHLFTLLWTCDVVLWWAAADSYAKRSPLYDRLLHGFMLLIIFNGTIVYERGVIRWAGVALFCWLGVWWYWTRRGRDIAGRKAVAATAPDRVADSL